MTHPWHSLAAKDLNAQYNLGVLCYHEGDLAQARAWFEQAAAGGSVDAQLMLGLLLGRGEGGPAEPARAAECFQRAAERGNATAQYHLGLRFRDGHGVAEDRIRAKDWLRQAASQGHPEAAEALAEWESFDDEDQALRR